jgi:hypothetical protein
LHQGQYKFKQLGIDVRIEPELIQPKRRSFHSPLTAFRLINHKSDPKALRVDMYFPISVGGIVVKLLALWLLGAV